MVVSLRFARRALSSAVVGLALALAGCSNVPPQSEGVRAAPAPASAATAARLFQQICIDNRADLSRSLPQLNAPPFVLNTFEAIYYNQSVNLSFKITPLAGTPGGICSMIWGNDQSDSSNRSAITRLSSEIDYSGRQANGLMVAVIVGLL
ncbi:MAG: hypothetical protein JKX69_08360 [Rhodobacteraceae bacterium]|nr:hypothetical protein [Paracoccaceae bacterium]